MKPTTSKFSVPASETALDDAILRALTQDPRMAVPDDFAAMVARRAVAQPQPLRSRWMGWGPRLALGSGALLTLTMFALAPHAAPSLSNGAFDAELLLLAELSGLLLFAHRWLVRD